MNIEKYRKQMTIGILVFSVIGIITSLMEHNYAAAAWAMCAFFGYLNIYQLEQ